MITAKTDKADSAQCRLNRDGTCECGKVGPIDVPENCEVTCPAGTYAETLALGLSHGFYTLAQNAIAVTIAQTAATAQSQPIASQNRAVSNTVK